MIGLSVIFQEVAHSRRQELCVRGRRVGIPCILFSCVKTAERMRSIEVRSWKTPMGRVLRRNFEEAPFDRVGGSDGPSLVRCLVAEASEEFVEIVSQAIHRGGIGLPQRWAKRRAAERTLGAASVFITACRSALTEASSALRTVLRTLRILCAQQR